MNQKLTLKDLLQIQFDLMSRDLTSGFTGEFVIRVSCRQGGIAGASLHKETNLRDLQPLDAPPRS